MLRPSSRSRRAGIVGALALGALVVPAILTSCEVAVNLGGLEGGCPPKPGATQVKVSPSGGSPFCIDSTEATNAQYQQFVNALHDAAIPGAGDAGANGGVPNGCQQVTSATPSAGWPYPMGNDSYPVVNVNWCQAYAFCQWEGKELCGHIREADSDGGPLSSSSMAYEDPTQSEWLSACTAGGTRAYPYGPSYAGSCEDDVDGGGNNGNTIEPVLFNPKCVGGVPGLYDMSGNVREWTNACRLPNAPGDPESTAFCLTMGGAFDETSTADLACAGERNWTRNAGAGDIGIRCCLEL